MPDHVPSPIGHYELTDVRTFVVVAESGSISKAARLLGHSKSVISQRMARLEGALGAELLLRSSRGVQLTETGAAYLAQATEGLTLMEAAAESVAVQNQGVRGTLRISAPVTFSTHFLSSVFCRFLHRHPGLRLELELSDHLTGLVEEGFDLGVRITEGYPEEEGEAVLLAYSRRVVCCSPDYAQEHGVPRKPADLVRHPAIGYTNKTAGGLWSFLAQPKKERFVPQAGPLEANNGEVMRDAAREGLGLAILPLFIVADDLRAGRLRQIRMERDPQPDKIFAISPYRKLRRLRTQLLLDHLQETLSEEPPWERDLPPPI